MLENLNQIFDDAYSTEWEKRKGKSTLRVIGTNPDGSEKVYEEEGNFFLCGFINLLFNIKDKDNQRLKILLEENGYKIKSHYQKKGWFWFACEKGACFNGDYLIGEIAYKKVADYLNDMGFEVLVEAILD